MSVEIQVRHDKRRGCGWRVPGGTYVVSTGVARACGLLPVPLEKCPTCSGGIKPSRGWTWIDFEALIAHAGIDCKSEQQHCLGCPFRTAAFGEQQGLLWVGGSFYKRPEDWTAEAIAQGVSRRISSVPLDFKVGETWVLVAHRQAILRHEAIILDGETKQEAEYTAAIFHAFKPTAIEFVVKGDETEEELERLVKRGITPIRVEL